MNGLVRFLTAVQRRLHVAVQHPAFHITQQELLERSVGSCRLDAPANMLGEPLALLYLVARAWGRELDEQAERVAAFCQLYMLAADLMDDVQDDDLDGKPHAAMGPALAINTAVTLLFLSLRELHESIELERDPARKAAYLRLFGRVSLLAAAGQHRDLMGREAASTPEQVLEMHRAKTSSVSLLTECGALLARCDDQATDAYREIGEQLVMLVQLRDDLRDIFGKQKSPDLEGAKMTHPVACYLASASPAEAARFDELVRRLPESIGELRQLLYESGAVESSAIQLERCRAAIHRRIADMAHTAPAHRTLLDIADSIAETVYAPSPLQVTRHLWEPQGAWHEAVRHELSVFMKRMDWLGCPQVPELRPWHNSEWVYAVDRNTLYYPDIEGQPEEVLPLHAALLGTDDLHHVASVIRSQLPALMAHEMFHFWRNATGRLTTDHWHEEWAANRLTVAYLARYAPETLQETLALARSVLAQHAGVLGSNAERILARCPSPTPRATGYDVDLFEAALIHLNMLLMLAASPDDLRHVSQNLLTKADEAGCAA